MVLKNYTADDLAESELNSSEKASSKLKKLVPILIAVAALIVVLIIVISNGSYKLTLNKYFDSIERVNGKKYASVITQYRKVSMAEYYDCKDDELIDEFEEALDDKVDDIDCGDKVKINYEISDENTVDKDDVEKLEEEINGLLDILDADPVKITAAVELKLDITVEGDEDSADFKDKDVYLVKENGKWKIYYSEF